MKDSLLVLSIIIYVCQAQFDAQSNLDLPREGMVTSCRSKWEWRCNSGECIALYDVCDGIQQCMDGSDELSCNEAARQRKEKEREKLTTTPPTTTTTPPPTYLALTKGQFLFMSMMLIAILSCVVCFVRRRARARALARNRRGKITQSMFTQDSEDEDDILISSMYS